ncbi:MAG: hypothetical protein ACOC8B_06585, partial [Gemmatimonadota bacterium]
LGLIGLGVEHFIFGQFVTARAPAWPEAVPGGVVWAYLTGAGFVIAGAAILAGRRARVAAVLAGALIFVWALLRNIPLVAGDAFFGGYWTNAGKSLVFFAGAFAIAGTRPPVEASREGRLLRFVNGRGGFLRLGRVALGAFFLMTGIQHYLHTPFVASLIPGWFPGDPVFWTRFAGVALVAGGVGMNAPWTARLASLLSGLMVFAWFWIVHLPRAFASASDGMAVFEALAVAGLAFVLAGDAGVGRRRRSGRDAAVAERSVGARV